MFIISDNCQCEGTVSCFGVMLKLIDIFGAVSILLSYAKNIFKSSNIRNTSFTSDKKLNNLLNAFLCHYIQELYTF